jgi:hypothetical protein
VLVIVEGEILDTVGCVKVVIDPPNETDEPLIVIALLANSELDTLPAGTLNVVLAIVTVSPDSPTVIVVLSSLGTMLSILILLAILSRCSW